jgi:hypothetical protein
VVVPGRRFSTRSLRRRTRNSTGTALSLSKVTPYIWVGIFMTWTVAYGRYQQKKGERMMATAAADEGPGTSDADPRQAVIAPHQLGNL